MRTISDDAGQPKPVTGTINSKAALRAILQAAVLNTGGVPLNGVVIGPPAQKPHQHPRQAEPAASIAVHTSGRPPHKSLVSNDIAGLDRPKPEIPRPPTECVSMTDIPLPDVPVFPASNEGAKVDMPTADEVARAIVAAARETQEDPVDIALKFARSRGRHYAMHALVAVFPGVARKAVARMVGSPGLPERFWENSVQKIAGPINGGRRKAYWWNDGAFQRVVAAITKS